MKHLPRATAEKTNPIKANFRAWPPAERRPRVTSHETRFCKTNPICKNAKQTETYVQKGLMKQLPHATAEKTKPICKNAKTNLTPCLKMTYENNQLFPPPPKQIGACLATLFGGRSLPAVGRRRSLRASFPGTLNPRTRIAPNSKKRSILGWNRRVQKC